MRELFERGRIARWEGRPEDAKRHFKEALAVCGDPLDRGAALTGLGQMERDEGNREEARRLYVKALDLYRTTGNAQRIAHTVRHVADMDRNAGDFAASESAYREALVLYRTDPKTQKLDLANALNGFASLLAITGPKEEAIELTKEARKLYTALHRKMGNLQPGIDECDERMKGLLVQS